MNNLRIIIGPPGTGKTTYLARQLERAAERYDPERIMACSFTRAAVAELNRRQLPIPDQNIGTLHSIGYRLLGNPELLETKKGIAEFVERNPKWGPLFQAEYTDDMDEVNVACQALSEFNYLRSIKKPLNLWPKSTQHAWEAWAKYKEDREGIDYADMIELPLKRSLYPLSAIGFFDEAQDFTPLETELVHLWGSQMDQYFLVGDPDQSIYGFKGSDPNLLNIKGHDYRVLSQSWRVPQEVHTLARDIITRNDRQDYDYEPKDDDGWVDILPTTLDEPYEIVSLAQSLPGSVMILASCAYMLRPIIAALKAEGIPFYNPYRLKATKWNPLYQSKRKGANIRLVTRIQAFLNDIWTPQDILLWEPLVKGVFDKNSREILRELPQEYALPVMRLCDIIGEDHAMDASIEREKWLIKHAKKNKADQLFYPIKVVRNNPEGIEPRIVIGTIHSVKGGEADHVIVAPDVSWNASLGDWDEINRVFYVAVTRAKESVHLLAPSRRGDYEVPRIQW